MSHVKTCVACGETKSSTEFYAAVAGRRETKCADCCRAENKRYRERKRRGRAETESEGNRLKGARMTGQHKRELFEQDAQCALCDVPLTRNNRVLLDEVTYCDGCRLEAVALSSSN